jgi:hypothetical protein
MNYHDLPNEKSFRVAYSRFKVIIFHKNGKKITHYGNEKKCTEKQIANGYANEFILDRKQGLQDCMDRISLCVKLYGKFSTAIIYDRLQSWSEVIKIVGDNVVVDKQEGLWNISPAKITAIVLIDQKNKKYKIIPKPDFKAELEKAINKG